MPRCLSPRPSRRARRLTLDERVRRLFADGEEPAAAFTPDGKLIYANAAAQSRIAGATTLAALSLQTLAFTALEAGNATGTARAGDTSFDVAAFRLGADAARVLALILPQQPSVVARPQSAPPGTGQAPPHRLLPSPPGAKSCLLNGGTRCVSSGTWTPTAASASARTNSSN